MFSFFSAFSLWDWVEIIGTVLVAIGCVGELCLIFEKPTNASEHSENQKSREHFWERIFVGMVAVGVSLELLALPVSLHHTAELELTIAQTTNKIAKIDPLNQLVSDISAVVSFRVKETEPSENTNWGMPRVAGLMLCESNCVTGNSNMSRAFLGASRLGMLEADKFDRYFDGSTLEYVLHFHREGLGEILMHKNDLTVKWALENTRYVDITAKFLPPGAEILDGSIVVTINSGPQIWFSISAQKDSDPNSGKSGYGYEIIASNPPEKLHSIRQVLKTDTN